MELSASAVRAYRLHAHHLDHPVSLDAAAFCGFQNSPAGAWENAAFFRTGMDREALRQALADGRLLETWSFRGAPVVFPQEDADIFLDAMRAQGDEEWIYTHGIIGVLAHMDMTFDELSARLMKEMPALDHKEIQGKAQLDQFLAKRMQRHMDDTQQRLWRMPSLYDPKGIQTMGEAAVSFLLRPCALCGKIVFSQRQKGIPCFTSFNAHVGHPLLVRPFAQRMLMRRFLHAYAPVTLKHFCAWLGCGMSQGRRLWKQIEPELEAVQVLGKTRYVRKEDLPLFMQAIETEDIRILAAHDPYLDARDHEIFAQPEHFRLIWRTVANPGVVLQGGRIIGIWRSRQKGKQTLMHIQLFTQLNDEGKQQLHQRVRQWADFQQKEVIMHIER